MKKERVLAILNGAIDSTNFNTTPEATFFTSPREVMCANKIRQLFNAPLNRNGNLPFHPLQMPPMF